MQESVLERNLSALARTNPSAADAVRWADPRADVMFIQTPDGVCAVCVGTGEHTRALCSRRRPLEEARAFADRADLRETGAVVVTGFGAGHHVAELARRMGRTGIVLCFEPDVSLLRAVLERIDHSAWLSETNAAVFVDAEDQASLVTALRGVETVVAMGVRLLDHGPTLDASPLGRQAGARFGQQVAAAVSGIRTTVVTSLVQVVETVRNSTQNLDRYITCSGVADLAGAAAGRPAVVVSAGPSLERNIAELKRPGVRDRVVVIAVQTVLKRLLAEGIRPHFVTALDWAEISRRFYEGLTADDVRGVTLVVEPKANPAILDAFPGVIRCVADSTLDELLGDELRRDMGRVEAGATVAHLAYYLARHMGCDPVVLVGQDLGFTDGQYYAARASIHEVWAPELGPMRTLEMFEWERIARQGHQLRPAADVYGRRMYTDEQMATYLLQFERDFMADRRKGLTTIDASEGGVRKQGADPEPLASVLDRLADGEPIGPALDELWREAGRPDAGGVRIDAVERRLREVRQDVWRIAELSRKAAGVLRDILHHQRDRAKADALIGKVHDLRDQVERMDLAFRLVQCVNQAGTFNRLRADRRILHTPNLDPYEEQRLRIERDIDNVTWLAESADELGGLLDHAVKSLRGGAKLTRDDRAARSREAIERQAAGEQLTAGERVGPVAAVVPLLFDIGGLGTPRDVESPWLLGMSPLRLTLERLARCRKVREAVIISDDPARARRAVGGHVRGLNIRFEHADMSPMRERTLGSAPSRLLASDSWRGGLASLTVFDELVAPAWLAGQMERLGVETALIVGPDWCLVDSALCDALVERREREPAKNRLTFTQAAPGLAGCVIARSLAHELGKAQRNHTPLASVGGLIGFVPAAPMADPIAKHVCVQTPPALRDIGLRCIADTTVQRESLARVLRPMGESLIDAPAVDIAARLADMLNSPEPAPRHVVLELAGPAPVGLRAGWWGNDTTASAVGREMDVELARRVIDELGPMREDAVVTLGGPGGAAPDRAGGVAGVVGLTSAARSAGFACVHVRTDLTLAPHEADALLDAPIDVLSIDLLAEHAATYEWITGADAYDTARANVDRLISIRRERAIIDGRESAMPTPWIVPRITRCDAAMEEVEPFYARWVTMAGACVIDPLPTAVAGERIQPLPLPALARRRLERSTLTISPAGMARMGDRWIRVGDRPISDLWQGVLVARTSGACSGSGTSHLPSATWKEG